MSEALIRAERPSDHAAVFAVERDAFGRDTEARLVDALRSDAAPQVSLVACAGDALVGHIFLSPVVVGGVEGVGMALGPVAVAPARQRRGVGGALVRGGLDACRALGRELVFLVGHPEYYPRFGFEPAGPRGFTYHGADLGPPFMVCALRPGALEGRSGDVLFHPAFQAAEADG